MNDLRTRMRIFDQVPAPSYWSEIELRASTAPEAATPDRVVRPTLLLVTALLLVLVIGGAALVLSGNVDLPGSSAPRLAYSLDGDIYLADLDGANPVLVADGAAANGGLATCAGFGGPNWSPDGRHFAYRSGWTDDCPGEVHVRDAEGRLVASVPGVGWDLSWSPDSTRIATWIDLWETIGIYGIDGERQALLTVPQCGSGDHDPVWSPDGKSVVVESWLCEVPIDGGTPRWFLFGTDPRANYKWVYSPDGTRVAYVQIRGEGDRSLVIAEADGTVLQDVHDESADVWYDSPVWSPSGDRVLFSWTPLVDIGRGAEILPHTVSELRVLDIGTGQVTTLAAEPGISPIGFSAEGDRILFSTRDLDGPVVVNEALWSMDADGSDPHLLVPNTTSGEWQPVTGSD